MSSKLTVWFADMCTLLHTQAYYCGMDYVSEHVFSEYLYRMWLNVT